MAEAEVPASSTDHLETLARMIRACTRCPLADTRTNAVPGEGSPNARVMFVGEGPGQVEDETGRPFVGPAGQLLDELLGSIGLARADVFITNIVKCRPPRNRAPLPDEREACKPYLGKQIQFIRPLILCTLGGPALAVVGGAENSISRQHGTVIQKKHYRLLPLYHPAAALHNPNLRSTQFEDIKELRRLLDLLEGAG